MEFWGTEVKPGDPQVNAPGDQSYCHVSQVALGPGKDGKSEKVVIRVETGGRNIVLGTLVSGKVDQMSLDLIFDREFTLSHTSTNSSVFFCGYKTERGELYSSGDEESSDEGEEDVEPVPLAVPLKENGALKDGKAAKQVKLSSESVVTTNAKSKKADLLKPMFNDDAMEDDSDEDDEDDGDETGSEDSDGLDEEGSSDDDEEDEEDEDDSEEELASELGKKRSFAAQKSPGGMKKPRLDTPAKPGLITTPAKKGGAKASAVKTTPVSAGKKGKEGGLKTPAKDASAKTSKVDTPGSVSGGESAKKLGAYHCAECKRNFTTESAFSQHTAAKHKK